MVLSFKKEKKKTEPCPPRSTFTLNFVCVLFLIFLSWWFFQRCVLKQISLFSTLCDMHCTLCLLLFPPYSVLLNKKIFFYSWFLNLSVLYLLKLCIFDFSRYSSLLSDCQHCYLSQRSQLLMPCVSDAIDKLAKQYERNPCSLVSFLNPFLNVAGLG